MLTVIEQQQYLAIADRTRDARRKIHAVRQLHIQPGSDQARQRARVACSGKVDPNDRIRLLAFAPAGQFQRELCFARSAGTRQRKQARRCSHDLQLRQFVVATDQLDTSFWWRGTAHRTFGSRDRGDPAVALGMDGLDEAGLQRIVAKQPPQFGNQPCQRSRCNDNSTPHSIEQRVAIDERSVAVEKHFEHPHRLRLCVQRDATARESCVSWFELELVKLVYQSADLDPAFGDE